MGSPRYKSVEDYLESLDDAMKAGTIRAVIDFVLENFPELEAKIAWNVPTIHRGGKYVVGICAYKKHLTFAPFSQRVIEDHKDRLGEYVVFKGCFQIPVDWKIEKRLAKDLVRARIQELTARA